MSDGRSIAALLSASNPTLGNFSVNDTPIAL